MSKPKKPKKPKNSRKPSERKPIVWPPEEWPEEARQAHIEAMNAFMEEWWKRVLGDMPLQPATTAEIIPFPDAEERAAKARDRAKEKQAASGKARDSTDTDTA